MAQGSVVCVALAGESAIVTVPALCGTAAAPTGEQGATAPRKLALPSRTPLTAAEEAALIQDRWQ